MAGTRSAVRRSTQTSEDDVDDVAVRPDRIPNAERSRVTRAALLDATITAIAEHGYQGATSVRIAEISGLTRGAQKHHFASKANLMAAALVEVHQRYIDETVQVLRESSGKDVHQLVSALWESLNSDLSIAALELRIAARMDDELRAALIPAEVEIGHRARERTIELLGDDAHSHAQLKGIVDLLFNALRGMEIQRLLYPDDAREQRQLRVLAEAIEQLLTTG